MKDILNNPWFVVALCAVASIYLGFSVGKPFFDSGDEFSSAALEVPPLDLAQSFESTGLDQSRQGRKVSSLSMGSLAGITWLDDVKRDPFASSIAPSGSVESDSRTAKVVKRQPLPQLSAVFVGRAGASAVLDGRLVRVGDVLRGFEVTVIEDNRVFLLRGTRTYELEPGS